MAGGSVYDLQRNLPVSAKRADSAWSISAFEHACAAEGKIIRDFI
jgi:hypothetical protein